MKDNDPRHDPESMPDLLKRFGREPGTFLTSDSSRATAPGQVWCRCDDPTHSLHAPGNCGEATFNEGYCRVCFAYLRGSTSGGEL